MRLITLIRCATLTLLLLPLWGNAATLAAGGSHTCALTVNGGVQCWGDNQYGQLGDGTTIESATPVGVSGLSSGVQAITAGWEHTCALTSAGGVQCWGSNGSGQLGDGTTTTRLTPVGVSGLSSGVQAIANGESHTCALTTAGGVQCWGYNGNGQLGDGTTTQRLMPIAVSGLGSGVQAIASGSAHTCALTTAGGVQCWGANGSGQLGDGTRGDADNLRLTPVAVSGLSSGVQAITAGVEHTCALTATGGVQCWGRNVNGQLGDGTLGDADYLRLTPVAVSGLSNGVQAIAAGYSYTCALTALGGVQCWGINDYGQLGDGTSTQRLMPVAVSGLSGGVQAIATGAVHTCALTTTGVVQCWGNNNSGKLGFGGFYGEKWIPTDVVRDGDGDGVLDAIDAFPSDLAESVDTDNDGTGNNAETDDDNDAVLDGSDNCPLRANLNQADNNANGKGDICESPAIATGYSHTCALTALGSVQCWGDNRVGQLGDGTYTNRLTPVVVSGLSSGVQAIANGEGHTCALTTAGGVNCWGYGALGDNYSTVSFEPVAVSGLSSGVQAIVAGDGYACALTTAGGVQCWGYNDVGQLGIYFNTYSNEPVEHIGLSSGVQAIAAGSSHTCALTGAGSVKCWGMNDSGQLGSSDYPWSATGVPVTVNGLVGGIQAITAGVAHTCALTGAGGVKCWGDNTYGQLGDGTTVQRKTPVAVSGLSSGVQAIAAGDYHTCALTTAGDVQCWGYNQYGQLGDGTATNRLTPIVVSGLSSGVITIAAGHSHTCVLTAAGVVQCWGSNTGGQLGDNTTTQRLIPVFVVGFEDSDGDGVLDASDAFPYDPTESLDTDNDGIGSNVDLDDDNDGVPDYIDADPLNAAVNTERLLPLNSGFKGSSVQESAAPL